MKFIPQVRSQATSTPATLLENLFLLAPPSFLDKNVKADLPIYRSITWVKVHSGEMVSFWMDNWSPAVLCIPSDFLAQPMRQLPRFWEMDSPSSPVSLVSLMLNWPRCRSLDQEEGYPAYKILSLHGVSNQSAESMRRPHLPMKLKIFALLTANGKLNTRNNLHFKHWSLSHNWKVLCCWNFWRPVRGLSFCCIGLDAASFPPEKTKLFHAVKRPEKVFSWCS